MENSTKITEAKIHLRQIILDSKHLGEYFEEKDFELTRTMDCLGFLISTFLINEYIDEEELRQFFRYIDKCKNFIQELHIQELQKHEKE